MELLKKDSKFKEITEYSFIEEIDKKRLIDLKKSKYNGFIIDKKSMTYANKYLKKLKNDNCVVRYDYAINKNFGRVYPIDGGLSMIQSDIRNYITESIYIDVDIKNAHPSFLYNISKILNIKCFAIEAYYFKREFTLDILSEKLDKSKKDIKKIICSIINGSTDFFDNKFLKLYNKDVISIYRQIYFDKNLKFIDSITVKEKNCIGKFMSYFLQSIENNIIRIANHFCRINSIEIGSIIHDGFLIKNDDVVDINSILENMNKYVKDNYNNFNIEFVVKEHPKIILPEIVEPTDDLSPKQICDYYYEFSKDYGSKIFVKDNSFWVCNDNNLWENGSLDIVKSILEKKDFNDYLNYNYKTFIDFNRPKEWDDLFRYFKLESKFKLHTSFEFDNNPQLLAFINKKCIVLNKFDKEKSWLIRDLLPKDFCSMSVNFDLDFDSNIDIPFCKTLISNMFQDSDTAESYLSIIGSSLYGELLYKHLFINKGIGNNGRSFFSNIMNNVLGDYFGTFNPEFFISNEFSSSEIKSPEAINNKFKRFISINEPPANKGWKKTVLDIEKIKLYSGNDIINARLLNSNKIDKFLNKAVIQMNCNKFIDIMNICEADKGRIVIIPQDTQFVDVPEYYYQKPILKDTSFIYSNSFKNSMILLLLDYWKKFVNNNLELIFSQQIIDITKELLSDYFDDFIDKYYIKSDDINDYIIIDNAYEHFLSNNKNPDKVLSKKSFINKLTSKGFQIKKINKIIDKNRVQKLAILFLKIKIINLIDDTISDEDTLSELN